MVKQKRWISGNELIERWGIQGFELLDFVKKGLQAYSWHGKKVINSDTLERAKRYSLAEIEVLERVEDKRRRSIAETQLTPSGRSSRSCFPRQWTDNEINQTALKKYEEQPLEIINPPKGCILMSFMIPLDNNRAGEVIKKVASFKFQMADVLKFEKHHDLYHPMEKGSGLHSEKKFMFLREGPTWTIRYEGETLKGFKDKGFEIIHYLIQNKNKTFSISELANGFGNIDLLADRNVIEIDTVKEKVEDSRKKAGKQFMDARDMIYGKPLSELKEHYFFLKTELMEAEENNDLARIEKANNDLTEICKYMTSYLKKNGTSRKFSDEFFKAQKRISKRIERALNKIKKYDENTWRHFNSALSPINNFFQSYRPDRDIDWLTEQ